jgi:hypothetical protein
MLTHLIQIEFLPLQIFPGKRFHVESIAQYLNKIKKKIKIYHDTNLSILHKTWLCGRWWLNFISGNNSSLKLVYGPNPRPNPKATVLEQ